MAERGALACPSAASDWDGAEVLGIVEGTASAPRLTYVRGAIDSAAARALLPDDLAPEEVFRFTAPCRGCACPQFRDGACGVAKAAVAHLDPVAEAALPPCGLRPDCRWWHDAGPDACRRCAVVVTADKARVGTAYAAALPFSPGDGQTESAASTS